MNTSLTVCAVVLTYNRQRLLTSCLHHLLGQTRPLNHILVVDNGSSDGTHALLALDFPGVEVLVLPRNVGAAGGFVAGMEFACRSGADLLWLMDDDAYPRPDALERLLEHSSGQEVLIPWQASAAGELYGVSQWRDSGVASVTPSSSEATPTVQMFSFIGPLIPRTVIESIGLPYADYFIDFFDWEYSLRLHQAGVRALLVPGSVIDHEAGQTRPKRFLGVGRVRMRYWQPAWRVYYDTRNFLLTVRRRHLGGRAVAFFLARQLREMLRELAFEEDGTLRVRLRLLAIADGLRGVSGERPGLLAPVTQKAVLSSPGKGEDIAAPLCGVQDTQPGHRSVS